MPDAPQIPPHDLDAEAAMLAQMLFGDGVVTLDTVGDVLTAQMFYSNAHRRVFEAIASLHASNTPIDLVAVSGALRADNRLAEVGGMPCLTELLNASAMVGPARARGYALTIKGHHTVRELLRCAQRTVAECYAGGIEDAAAYVDGVASRVNAIAETRTTDTLVTLKDALRRGFDGIRRAAERGGVAGTPSGIAAFDAVTGGLHAGDLIVVAGRPGMGKSALAFGIGLSVAKAGEGFLGFSLEMPDDQVAIRAACIEAGVNLWKTRNGQLTPNDWRELTDGCVRASALPYWIDPKPGVTVPEMRTAARRVQRELAKSGKRLGLVVVDYVQLARSVNAREREQQISEITRSLKELAKDLGVAIVALSQLNREVEKRSDKRPMLSDLRESGAIEQDADAVVFVYRDGYYNADSRTPNLAELVIAKQRNGPLCTVHAYWEPRTASFRDLTDQERRDAGLEEEGMAAE